MILGALGEWIMGNTFPFVVFGSFGMSQNAAFSCGIPTDYQQVHFGLPLLVFSTPPMVLSVTMQHTPLHPMILLLA